MLTLTLCCDTCLERDSLISRTVYVITSTDHRLRQFSPRRPNPGVQLVLHNTVKRWLLRDVRLCEEKETPLESWHERSCCVGQLQCIKYGNLKGQFQQPHFGELGRINGKSRECIARPSFAKKLRALLAVEGLFVPLKNRAFLTTVRLPRESLDTKRIS